MLALSFRNSLTRLGARHKLPQAASITATASVHCSLWHSTTHSSLSSRTPPLLLLSSPSLSPLMRAGNIRWYMTGGGRRRQNNNLWSIVPVWARPAIYMAGSTALIIIAWPVLRFVVIGGLAYGAYKLVSLWRMWRQAVNWATRGGMEGSMQLGLVEDIRKEAQACLLASCVNGDSLVLEMIPDSVADDNYEKAIELGSAVDMQTIEEEGTPQMLAGLAGRIKAVFPVVINGRRLELFVAASAKFGSARLELDAVSIYTRLGPSGQIVETKIDTSAAAGREGNGRKGSGRRHKREARDADYKEL